MTLLFELKFLSIYGIDNSFFSLDQRFPTTGKFSGTSTCSTLNLDTENIFALFGKQVGRWAIIMNYIAILNLEAKNSELLLFQNVRPSSLDYVISR